MKRKFIAVAAVLVGLIFVIPAQAKPYKIAIMRQRGPASLYGPMVEGFKHALDVAAAADGDIKVRYAFDREYSADKEGGKAAAEDAVQLLDKGVDLVVTVGSAPTLGARKVLMRSSVPQIYMAVSDPQGQGLIKDAGQPSGTNITGVSYFLNPVKEIEFIKKVMPEAKVCVYAYDSTVTADLARKDLFDKISNIYEINIVYRDVSTEEGRQALAGMKGVDVVTGWLGYAILKQKGVDIPNPEGALSLGVGTKEYVEEWGGLAAIIMDGFGVGRQAGVMAAKLISGDEAIEDIMPEDPKDLVTIVNIKKALEAKVNIPFDVLVGAKEIIK